MTATPSDDTLAPRSITARVTIGVPVFNGERHISEALTALLAQTYQNIQILVSDNASTDRTEEITRQFAARDFRVSYFRQNRNIGATKNFDYCRSQAVGDYFMWAAADDCLSPEFVERCVDELSRDASLALVSGQIRYRLPSDSYRYAPMCNLLSVDARQRAMDYLATVGENGGFYGLYRISMISDCRLANIIGGDWLWIAEVALSGKVMTIQTTYIIRDDSARGVSEKEYFKRLTRTLQTHWVFAKAPKLALCLGIPYAMMFRSSRFARLSTFDRLVISLRALLILAKRMSLARLQRVRAIGQRLTNIRRHFL